LTAAAKSALANHLPTEAQERIYRAATTAGREIYAMLKPAVRRATHQVGTEVIQCHPLGCRQGGLIEVYALQDFATGTNLVA
jgi:hypothetical protein